MEAFVIGACCARQGGMSQEAARRQVEAETAEAAPPPLPPVRAPESSLSLLLWVGCLWVGFKFRTP